MLANDEIYAGIVTVHVSMPLGIFLHAPGNERVVAQGMYQSLTHTRNVHALWVDQRDRYADVATEQVQAGKRLGGRSDPTANSLLDQGGVLSGRHESLGRFSKRRGSGACGSA